jgi:hypothetical protein
MSLFQATDDKSGFDSGGFDGFDGDSGFDSF